MKRLIALVALVSTVAYSEDLPTVQSFAMKQSISVANESPLHSFEVPTAVYQTVTSPQLHDIRIFNAAGSIVPFEVQNIEDTTQREELTTPLPFFPIKGSRTAGGTGNTAVQISQDTTGKIVSVQFGDTKNSSAPSTSYLIDLRNFHHTLESLRFQWESSEQMVGIQIEASNDLKTWRIVASGVLANLDYLGHAVSQNSVECAHQAQYLRISTQNETPLTLHGVDALYTKTDTIEAAPRIQEGTSGETLKNQHAFLYDTGGALPVNAINIGFSEKNVVARLTLSSRADTSAHWIERLEANAYTLSTVNGPDLLSGFLNLHNVVTDRYWKVETRDIETTLSAPPMISFRWRPHRILFIAQGAGPFTVAYGSYGLKDKPYRTNDVSSLAQSLKVKPSVATLSDPQPTGAQGTLTPPPARVVVEWKKWILWGVLAVGLLLVLGMAKGLLREMGDNK